MGKQSESSSLLLRGENGRTLRNVASGQYVRPLTGLFCIAKIGIRRERGGHFPHRTKKEWNTEKSVWDYEFILENTAGSLPLINQSIGSANG